MKTFAKSLLVLALVAVPFLALTPPADAGVVVGVGVQVGPGYHHHHHHHYYRHHHHHYR